MEGCAIVKDEAIARIQRKIKQLELAQERIERTESPDGLMDDLYREFLRNYDEVMEND